MMRFVAVRGRKQTLAIQQIWQLSGLGLRSNFGIEGVVGLERANSTRIRAFSAPNGFLGLTQGVAAGLV